MPEVQGAQRKVAIAAAVVALVVAIVAAIVVIARSGSASAPVPIGIDDREIAAADLMRLREWHAVDPAGEGNGKGVKVRNAELARVLGLAPADVITSISGRRLARDFDVYVAISSATASDATTVYAELAGGKLVRWHLGSSTRDPDAPDPLASTVQRIDSAHAVVPRATAAAFAADPLRAAGGVQVVQAFKDHRQIGFQLSGISRRSLLDRLGFRDGDTIVAINGYELTTAEKAAELYGKLKSSDSLTFDLDRSGTPAMLTVEVR
jgi:S1-C subfamily serine protease